MHVPALPVSPRPVLSADSRAFLFRLLDAVAPSGFESPAARIWRDEARGFATVSGDVAGNSIAVVQEGGAPTIMLAGHVDEIGVIVNYIDDDGFVYVGAIGGWDAQVLVGQRIRFSGRAGDVFGVVGKKSIHLQKPDERDKAAKLTDLWVDVGAANGDDARRLLEIGDPGVIDTRVLEMPNDRIASRAIDNRIGAFVVLEALRRYAARPGAARMAAVGTTQEEIGYHGGGALVSAARLNPAMAIAVDVTHASDHPDAMKKEIGEHPLGSGPVLARGSVISPVVLELLRESARELEIPVTVQAAGRETNTDADFIQIAREGVATALVSIPNRYMHSPGEMVSLLDVDRAAELLAEACRRVTPATNFAAR